ncbi:MAG TPA: alpha/beta fold hydrolase [Gammaproteobacteria bacterium]|nr:alpha/beta fold hydrolase [Gammaproteobacteria bacterium]
MTELLDRVEIATGSTTPTASVIWLHGLGADGHDFEPIVPELGLEQPIRFVFPHAPVRPVTLNAGTPMRAWYDLSSIGEDGSRNGPRDDAGINESQQQVEQLIAREKERGVASDRIVLAGFSQGGAIALHTGIHHAEPLAGIVGLSTYLHTADSLPVARDANRQTPIFMAHGTQDPMVGINLGERSRDKLREHGYTVEWQTYPMPHAVCPEEIAALAEWLKQRL